MEPMGSLYADPRVIPTEVGKRIMEYRQTTASNSSDGSASTESPSATEASEAGPRCPVCLDVGFLRRPVPVGDPDFGRAIECTSCPLVAEHRAAKLFRQAAIPPHFAEITLDSFPSTAENMATLATVRDWATGPGQGKPGRSLLLWGKYGRGKTGLAVGAMRAAMTGAGVSGLFLTTPSLLDRIRSTYGPGEKQGTEAEVVEAVKQAPLLVLDDLGAERATDWVAEKLFTVINHRHDYQLRTIFTSNLSPEQLALHLGERTVWRITEMSYVLELTGPNLREGA